MRYLKILQQLKEQQQYQRADQAKQSFEAALNLVEVYQQAPAVMILKRILFKLLDCIAQRPDWLAPYVVIGYIYHGLNLPELALRYLQAAQTLQPQAAEVQKLRDLILTPHPLSQVQIASSVDLPELSPLDNEDRHEQLKALIAWQSNDLKESRLPLRPLPSYQHLNEIAYFKARLEQFLSYVEHEFISLEEELDLASLRLSLAPIEERLKQLAQLHQQSLVMVAVQKGLIQQQQDVLALLQAPENLESALAKILDRTERLADYLQELESEGITAVELQEEFEQLQYSLQVLQEILDNKEEN